MAAKEKERTYFPVTSYRNPAITGLAAQTSAMTNQVPLDEMNRPPKAVSEAQLRRDAYASARLPLTKADQCPEDLLNRILWRAAKGPQTPYPVWAVKVVDDD